MQEFSPTSHCSGALQVSFFSLLESYPFNPTLHCFGGLES